MRRPPFRTSIGSSPCANFFLGTTAASIFAVLGSPSALAAESGFYAGLNIGQAEHDLRRSDFVDASDELTNFRFSMDTKSIEFGGFAGWQLGRWVAIEGSLEQLGQFDLGYAWTFAMPPSELWRFDTDAELTARAASVSALLTVPLGESFVLALRAGAAYSKLEVDSTGEFRRNEVLEEASRNSETYKNLAPVYGVGLEYYPTRRFSLRLDWRTFKDVGEEDEFEGLTIETLALSALMRF